MAKYSYTAQLSDFSGTPLPAELAPIARIVPERAAQSPDGTLLDREIPVTIDANGTCRFTLVASADTAPPTLYTLVVDWTATTAAGQTVTAGTSSLQFTALAGGGDIKTMGGAPASAIYVGPPWPLNTPPGVYLDRETRKVGYKEAR